MLTEEYAAKILAQYEANCAGLQVYDIKRDLAEFVRGEDKALLQDAKIIKVEPFLATDGNVLTLKTRRKFKIFSSIILMHLRTPKSVLINLKN